MYPFHSLGLQHDRHVIDNNLNADSRPGETQWTTRMMPTRAEKPKWMPGDRVKILKGTAGGCYGVVRTTYISKDVHKKHWVGIELDQPFGRHDGMAEDGVYHFKCTPKHGIYIRAGQGYLCSAEEHASPDAARAMHCLDTPDDRVRQGARYMAHETDQAKTHRLRSDLKKVKVKVAMEEEDQKQDLYEINEQYTKERHRWGSHVQDWGSRTHHGTQPGAMSYGQLPGEWRNPDHHGHNHHHAQTKAHTTNPQSDKHYDPDGFHYTDHPHGALPTAQSVHADSHKTGDIHTPTMHLPPQNADPATAKKLQGNVPVGGYGAMMHHHPAQGGHDTHPHQVLQQAVGHAQHPDAFFAEHMWASQSKTAAKMAQGAEMQQGKPQAYHAGSASHMPAGPWGAAPSPWGGPHPHQAHHLPPPTYHPVASEFGASQGAWGMQQGTQQTGAHPLHNGAGPSDHKAPHMSYTTHPAHAGAVYHEHPQHPMHASWGAAPGVWPGSSQRASSMPPQQWAQQSAASTQPAQSQWDPSHSTAHWGAASGATQADDFSKHTLTGLRDELLKMGHSSGN